MSNKNITSVDSVASCVREMAVLVEEESFCDAITSKSCRFLVSFCGRGQFLVGFSGKGDRFLVGFSGKGGRFLVTVGVW